MEDVPSHALYFDLVDFIKRGRRRANNAEKPMWIVRPNVMEDLALSVRTKRNLAPHGDLFVQAMITFRPVSFIRYRNCLVIIEPQNNPGRVRNGGYTFETEYEEDIILARSMCHFNRKPLPWSECIDFQSIVLIYDHALKAYFLKYVTKPVIFTFSGVGISPNRVSITISEMVVLN